MSQNKIWRKLSVVVGIIILIGGGYLASRVGKSSAKPTEEATAKAAEASNTTYVYAQTVENTNRSSKVQLNGKVIARQKIDVFSEVTGTLEQTGQEFREGVRFRKGQLLLQVDDTDAKLELQAAKSQLHSSLIALLPDLELDYASNFQAWKAYIDQFDVNEPLPDLPEIKEERERLFVAARNIYNQFYTIKRQEYRLTKYRIYAPFDGVLTSALVYKGALVRSGQRLGELTHPSRYELEATVSLYDLPYLKVGNSVALRSEATKETWTGKVARFGKTIDEKTQTQKVFITLNSSALNEGMYLTGSINAQAMGDVMALPRTLLLEDNTVYVLQDNKLQRTAVTVMKIDGNNMYVRGLEEGTQVLAQPVLGAYEGMPVQIIDA